MSDSKTAPIEFEDESKSNTEINPTEINRNPEEYARKVASDRATEYDKMAGFSVPRDFVMIPSKGRIYPQSSPLHNMEEIEVRHLTAADEDIFRPTRQPDQPRQAGRGTGPRPGAGTGTRGRRANHPSAPQDRKRSETAALSANRARRRLYAGP